MPIESQNIVFVESQVMDDVPEGGGAATGRVIDDGQMNNVFEDISDLDRAYGRFNLRKIAVAVRTLSTDLFGGAKTVVTALPQDPAIAYTLFDTADPFDTRADAANQVEAYLYKGPTWHGHLWENHIAGMRAISIIQRIGTTLPPVGKTLCLVQDEGEQTEREQYVRITKVTTTEATFTDTDANGADFQRWIVTLDLADALRHDFAGHTPKRIDALYTYPGRTRIRDTTVADATRYCGAQPLAAAAAPGDLTVRAASMFTQLVPSAQTETPLVNQVLAPELTTTVNAGTRDVQVAQQAHTLARPVTAENRRLNWIETLLPIPAPGALSLAYRAQGNWYTLTDDGTGTLSGTDPGHGAGTLDHTTGAMAVTLGALPDVGSQIMITWASPVHYAVRAGATADAAGAPVVRFTLTDTPVILTTVQITWTHNSAPRTATTDAAGAITGAGVTGTARTTGEVELTFTDLPDASSTVTAGYQWLSPDDPQAAAEIRQTATVPSNSLVNIDLGAAIAPNSLLLVADYSAFGNPIYAYPSTGARAVRIRDDGAGQLVTEAGQDLGNPVATIPATVVGTIDYATGLGTIHAAITANRRRYWSSSWGWVINDSEYYPTAGSTINIIITTGAAATGTPAQLTHALADNPLPYPLTTTITDQIVPGSVQFTLAGKTYEDRAGTLYTDIDPQTGSGLVAGTLDYDAGLANLTHWTTGAAANLAVTSCLTVYGQWTSIEASFRTTAAPIKPEALSITATTIDGTQITATADPDGLITGPAMRGQANYEFGTAAIEFGQYIDDPDHIGDPPAPQIWAPIEVDPTTIRYNAVAYSYLPLDADILGIDAVRLPSDGRVPIYRPGDIALIMHTADTAPATIADGGTIDCGRTRIGWVRLLDATGATVPTGYELDRATGIVTVPSVAGLTQPLTVRHTVADLRMLTDVQITGDLTLARPLTHTYPADGTAIVASCLIHGDRRARVSAVWDQQTWDGTWTDGLIGNEATATLDTIAHPIQVTNEGAETERWVLRWTSTTNVELIGQRRGLVYAGPFTADIAPINPRTRAADGTGGVPYLHIPLAANGGGWSAGNIVRINTVGAIAPLWIARAIQQSDEPLDDGADGCELYCLGNIDRP